MKRKILFLCFSFLIFSGLSALEKAPYTCSDIQTDSGDGTYVFSKVTLVISNFDTKQEVESYTITDPATIDSTNFHFNIVFLQAIIYNGTLTECILSNKQGYMVKENILEKYEKKEVALSDNTDMDENEEVNLSDNTDGNETEQSIHLSPYKLTLADDKATFEFLYPLGDSRYNFPLEAKLTIILTKQ